MAYDFSKLLGNYQSAFSDSPLLSGIDTPEEYQYALSHPFSTTSSTPSEAFSYWAKGVSDPEVISAWQSGNGNPSLRAAVSNPELAGIARMRTGLDLSKMFGDPRVADDPQAAIAEQAKYGITPEMWNPAATSWSANNTAAAQAARDKPGMLSQLAPIILGVGGMALGIPPVWAGALSGAAAGATRSDNPSDWLKSGAKGAALAYAGGEIAKGISNAAGYQPNVANAIWSESATPTSSWLTQAGINAGTNAATNIGKSTISNLFGNAPQTNTRTGGTMPTLSTLLEGNGSLTDYASAAAPFLSAWQTNQQKNRTGDVYDRATNLIQTPSPDQAKYRGMLSDLMTNPGSFYDNPVYQSQFEQGRNALERSQSARGNLGSGGAMAELQKYGMGQGANQFNTMAGLLSGLSGIGGDQQARAMAAAAMLKGNESANAMDAATLGRIGQGLGVQSPEEKLFREWMGMLKGGGNTGGGGGGSVPGDLTQFFSSPDYGSYINYTGLPGSGTQNTTDFMPGDWGYNTITTPGDWGNTTDFAPGDWGYGTDTSWQDWFN